MEVSSLYVGPHMCSISEELYIVLWWYANALGRYSMHGCTQLVEPLSCIHHWYELQFRGDFVRFYVLLGPMAWGIPGNFRCAIKGFHLY